MCLLFLEREATQLGMNKSVLDKLVKFGDSDSNMLLKGLLFFLHHLCCRIFCLFLSFIVFETPEINFYGSLFTSRALVSHMNGDCYLSVFLILYNVHIHV